MTPNILLIVFDTARADAFEPYGAAAGASPTIAQLAAAGKAHTPVFSTACWTAPAHASLFSGMLPRAAGFGHVGGTTPQELAAGLAAVEDRLLPSVLAKAGYVTLGASSNLWISPSSGFDLGFDHFEYITGERHKGMHRTDPRGRARWVLDAVRARADDGAAAVLALIDGWMGERRDRPFFLFVNLVECHSPYLPPRPWNPLGPVARARAAIEAQRHLNFGAIWKGSLGGYDIPDGALARMRAGYTASIRQMDDWLARVLDLLDRRRLLADTEVVVTSDHGENLGEGQLIGHAFSLDDRLIRIPLVTSGPVALHTEPGTVLSIADVPRLLAEVAELEEHPWPEPPAGDAAVAQFDAVALPDNPRIAEALEAWKLGEDAERRLITSFACATNGSLKLIRRLGHEELFDLALDPMELAPVRVTAGVEATYGTRLAPLRAALDRAERSEAAESNLAPPSGELAADDVAALEDQMRLLGYL